jgi:Spy/CpxP family protein refolding chaperone
MGVRTTVKNHPFSAWQFGRRFALGAITLLLVISASGRSAAISGRRDARVEQSQSSGQRGQATPSRPSPDVQKPSQPRVPWWKDPVVVKELRLTPDQSSRIDAIWKKRETDMHAASKEYERQREELNRLMAERKVGVDVIGVQHDRVEAQRTTLNKSRTIMIYQFSLVLTPEQNTALKAYFERNRRRDPHSNKP